MTGGNRWLALFGACAVACAVYDNQTPGMLGGGAGETASTAGSSTDNPSKGPGGTGSGSSGGPSIGASSGSGGTPASGGTTGVVIGGDDSGGEAGLAGANTEGGTTGGVPLGGHAGLGGASGAAGHAGSGGSAGNSANGGAAGTAGSGGTSGSAGTSGSTGTSGSAGTGGNGGTGGGTPTCSDHPLTARSSWLATASDQKSTDVPANLLDNKITRWTTGKPQAGGEWLQLDFGSTVSLDYINLQQGTDTNDYPRGYTVIVSDTSNDSLATPVATGSGKTGVSTAISLPSMATGRYLLITQTGSSLSWWSAEEIEVSCSN